MRKWFGHTEGTAAVEFVLVGFPFIFMIVGLVEMAVMFTSQSILQDSTFTAARLIRTGQLQQSNPAGQEEMFRDSVCDLASLTIPCSRIQFQVRHMDTFEDAEDIPPVQFDADGNLMDQAFDPGGVGDVVMIRVVYNYEILTPLMQPFLANNDSLTRTMVSTVFFETEPYEFQE